MADNGQVLRGPYESTEWTSAAPQSEVANIKNLGFNAVHLYAESFDPNYPNAGSTTPGYAVAEVDKFVQMTRDLGLYLVMTIGNGANNGNHNRQYVVDFWDFYAPRYANETHVVYEIQNEPMAWGPSYLTGTTPPGALDMEVEAYNTIRSHAPDTPVLLFSYAVLGGTGGRDAALTDIHAFNQQVFGNPNAIWTKEAVGFHGYGGWKATSEAVAGLIAAGYPCFMTEYAASDWGGDHGGFDVEMTSELERLGVSWLTFQYIPPSGVSDDVTQPECYQDRVDNAGLSWTPDFGTWPAARSPYDNGEQPRHTTSNWANEFLTGTLRIEAEDFDTGGQGVAYNDTDPTNNGGQYRGAESVDIETTADTGGGRNVGWTNSGEWLEYTIWVDVPGYYNVGLRFASIAEGSVQLELNGKDKTGIWTLPGTGGWQTWITETRQVFLEFGRQKLRLNITDGAPNLNWVELTPSATGPIANGTYRLVNRNSGMAMEHDTGNNRVVQQPYSSATVQQWNFQHLGAGAYKVSSVSNNDKWNQGNQLGLTWWWGTDAPHQHFIVRPASDGYHHILPTHTGRRLKPENGSLTSGAAIVASGDPTAGAEQQWAIQALTAPAIPSNLTADWVSSTQVHLRWTAAIGATSYTVMRATSLDGPYTTIAAGVTGTIFSDIGLIPGATYYYKISATASGQESLSSAVALASLPYPWTAQDVGAVGISGNATFRNGAFTLGGSGSDIWGTTDAFQYAFVTVSGDCTVEARVVSVQNIDPWSKAGVMIRESLDANARNAFVAVTPGNGVTWQYRSSAGGNTRNANTTGLNAPHWVRLVRSGDTFTGFRSADGVTWTQVGSTTLAMGTTVYVGLALTSHHNSNLCTATFDNVTVPSPTPPPALVARLKFDETSGTTAADITGNGWTGTLHGGATWEIGDSCNAVLLDGADAHVSLPDGVLNGLGGFTISTWVKLNSISTWARIFDFGTGTNNYMFLTPRSGGSGVVRFAIRTPDNNEQIIDGNLPLTPGAWTHVAVTVSGAVGTLYVNGSIVGTNNSMSLTPSDLGLTTQNYIGKSQWPDPHLEGTVNDFRIYDSALNALAIASVFLPPAAPSGLIATAGSGQVALEWETVNEATAYNIKRAMTGGGPYITVASGVTKTHYTDSSVLNGTTYYYILTASNVLGEGADSEEASASPTLVIEPRSFEIWESTHFTPSEILAGNSAAQEDPDADQLPNLAEYALGTDPHSFTPQPTTTRTDNEISITFQRPAHIGDVSYHAEVSSDLGVWEELSLEVLNPGADPETVKATKTLNVPLAGRQFIRLRFVK